MADQCSTCMFSRNAATECHYDAPTPGTPSTAGWPPTAPTQWCGDGISTASDHHQFSPKYNRQGMLGPAN